MKILKNMSIKLKVMLPIAILGIAVLLAGISSLINSKRLLNAGVVISNDCSQSIELLMDMSADLESMGKNMYAHCDADNSTSKNNFKNTIDSKMEDMQGYFDEYKKIIVDVIDNPNISVVANINIGHATPRCIIPFGIEAEVDAVNQKIRFA